MIKALVPALVLAASAGVAHAQSQTVSVPFSYNPVQDFNQLLSVPQFDTLGGTRTLQSVGIVVNHDFDLSLVLENTSDTNLLATDYVYEHINATIVSFGDLGGGEGEGEGEGENPFPGLLGGLPGGPGDGPGGGGPGDGPGGGGGAPTTFFYDTGFFTVFDREQDLAPYDGTSGVDGLDQVTQDVSNDFTNSQVVSDPNFISLMTGAANVDMQVGGLIENFFQLNFNPGWGPYSGPFGQPIYPVDEALWFRLEGYLHSGTIEVTYNFVPTPGAAGMLGLVGVGLISRRRR